MSHEASARGPHQAIGQVRNAGDGRWEEGKTGRESREESGAGMVSQDEKKGKYGVNMIKDGRAGNENLIRKRKRGGGVIEGEESR